VEYLRGCLTLKGGGGGGGYGSRHKGYLSDDGGAIVERQSAAPGPNQTPVISSSAPYDGYRHYRERDLASEGR
jgi:hypothetical protein